MQFSGEYLKDQKIHYYMSKYPQKDNFYNPYIQMTTIHDFIDYRKCTHSFMFLMSITFVFVLWNFADFCNRGTIFSTFKF